MQLSFENEDDLAFVMSVRLGRRAWLHSDLKQLGFGSGAGMMQPYRHPALAVTHLLKVFGAGQGGARLFRSVQR
jgi:hypothetical protein